MEIIILTLMMGFLLAVFIAIPRVFKSGKKLSFDLNLVIWMWKLGKCEFIDLFVLV